MESVNKKMKELLDWVRENGYQIDKYLRAKEVYCYRLDDRFYRYDLIERKSGVSTLFASLLTDEGHKVPLWAAHFKNGEFKGIVSGRDIMKIGRGLE